MNQIELLNEWWLEIYVITRALTFQVTFPCSKSAIETLEKGVNMFKVNNKNSKTTSLTPFWCFFVNFEYISHIFLVSL